MCGSRWRPIWRMKNIPKNLKQDITIKLNEHHCTLYPLPWIPLRNVIFSHVFFFPSPAPFSKSLHLKGYFFASVHGTEDAGRMMTSFATPPSFILSYGSASWPQLRSGEKRFFFHVAPGKGTQKKYPFSRAELLFQYFFFAFS